MKMYSIFLFMLFPFLSLGQAGFLKKNWITQDGNQLPYRVLYPEKYDSSKAYPLVLFLHGRGERGNDNEAQLKYGSHLFLDKKNREKFPCIVVFPQCPESSYWASADIDRSQKPFLIKFDNTRESNWPLNAAVDLVKSFLFSGNADPERLYLLGISMGGMGTLEILGKYPGLFSAAMPVCGGGDLKFINRYADRTAIWFFHGDKDSSVNVNFSRNQVRELKILGAKVKYTEYKNTGHNSWDKAFAKRKLLPWLFRQRKVKIKDEILF